MARCGNIDPSFVYSSHEVITPPQKKKKKKKCKYLAICYGIRNGFPWIYMKELANYDGMTTSETRTEMYDTI